jgi:hypothetical protein
VKLPAWTPFAKASLDAKDQAYADATGVSGDIIFLNSRYQVNIRPLDHPVYGEVAHLSIKSRDKSARHDWRDFQRIKNELCGEECEAIEIYPAESRCVDTANQFHLWVFRSYRVDLGWQSRLVASEGSRGAKQRPFEAGAAPADAKTAAEMDALIDGIIQQRSKA